MQPLKPVCFVGPSLDDLRAFPKAARREVGYQLDRVQHGLEPSDWKPMKRVGPGACEIRVQHDGQYRVVYVAKLAGGIYVLHAFQKKTRRTSDRDVEVAKRRLKDIRERRQ